LRPLYTDCENRSVQHTALLVKLSYEIRTHSKIRTLPWGDLYLLVQNGEQTLNDRHSGHRLML